MSNLAFSVDTHLLRELGALLVGRDSTALVELIKNAYDADATKVVVYGERLADHGQISVSDDGHGMTYVDFREKFLRIAGRSKEGGDRRSPIFKRKYTGAKGIGRLSAHKLGEALALESAPDLNVLQRSADDVGFDADINWTAIEESVASIEDAREIEVRPRKLATTDAASGTLLTITRLHSEWSPSLLNRFLAEVRSTRADPALTGPLPDGVFVGEPLVPSLNVSDTSDDDKGFTIELAGDFEGSEAQWPTLLSHVSWMLEIDALDESVVTYRISPSKVVQDRRPEARAQTFTWRRNEPGPRFVARIFVRDQWATRVAAMPDLLTKFANEAAGIRLFFEGFRVLPYGAPRNDWLGLGSSYAQRTALDLLEDVDIQVLDPTKVNEKTYRLASTSYFGGVFLHDKDSAGLQMVVNREGFLPGNDFEELTSIVKRGINISTRMRAALGAQQRLEAKITADEERQNRHAEILQVAGPHPKRNSESPVLTTQQRLSSWLEVAEEAASALRGTGIGIASDDTAKQNVAIVSAVLEEVRAVNDDAAKEQSQLRVLASLGTQVGAFVHEVNGILAQAAAVRSLLDRIIDDSVAAGEIQTRLRRARKAQNEVVAALERQAVYLSDSLGAEARRRRVRNQVSDRWATAVRLLSGAASRRNVLISDGIPRELKTPPMFPAEVNVIFTNVLSNAIKAASVLRLGPNPATESDVPEVHVTGSSEEGVLRMRIENTGVAVDLADSERWFRPFETTTTEVDAALGQGLGLGLSLTRRIVEEYGGGICFVEPSKRMATAIEIWLPNRR